MAEENSFVGMKTLLMESVIEAGINYDDDGNAESYSMRRYMEIGDFMMTQIISSPKEENKVVEAPEEVIDLTTDDEDEQPRHPP
ncbi:hypothetical protein ACET3Z_011608 [Daucus carota]